MTSSIFWYDYETTGINPRSDRAIQVAGIRTDEALNEIEQPLNIYCRPSDDILPHPAACLVTGILPQTLREKGLDEGEFITRVHAELSRPGTCGAGYNTLRFDDEVTRYSFYRNFHDPYAREWQGGNSRWDLIDTLRTAYALRPEGIEWPTEEGRVSLRLERLTAANGIDHGQAHEALADVRATIALARLVRDRQPRLYDFLFQLRSKHKVQEQIRLLQPLVHISGRFSAARHYFSVVVPLAWHPKNRNALIVCDLLSDVSPLLDQDAETLRRRLYTRRDELAEGEIPVPLKLLHINRCPVVAPLSVLRPADQQRLHVDLAAVQESARQLAELRGQWQDKLPAIYAEEAFPGTEDPEQQLYDGFIGDRDRRLCEQVRNAEPLRLAQEPWPFDDVRLPELLFRYRARNFPDTLSPAERDKWSAFCRGRLSDPALGAPNTLAGFEQAMAELRATATPAQLAILQAWSEHATQLRQRYGL
ncbi:MULTISPECIES: exodeoxyribonuclease I [unclassified Pseudomonas]|uniref:exodeoxyribonuclease I n=1 Tax=unclassified Pseudomonas TaxID=196821 RepID=UPI002305E2C7|nr:MULTISPECIES: exodeoxyribonuclease I [unclassified Pseudomonas]MDU9414941.1 exodeoxyribonuclease I [Pseudomonas sp. zfem005]WCD81752.1 exodeoxyribonuclease I [Pseudomonas sp. TUM22785]